MSYSFTIGNGTAVTEPDEDDPTVLRTRWEVPLVELADAPCFPNDVMTGRGNARHPGYSAWHEFCLKTGISSLFYRPDGNLKAGHPGCQRITAECLDLVTCALDRWRSCHTLPPGFAGFPVFDEKLGQWVCPDEDKYDPFLARLIWLKFWMAWALDTCPNPVIKNT